MDTARRYRAQIRAEMAFASLKASDMARKLGIEPETFSRKMNGHRDFSEREMRAIQRTFGWKTLGGEK